MPKKINICSFCGKSKDEVNKLIASDNSSICDECVEKCGLILQDDVTKNEPVQHDLNPHDLTSFLNSKLEIMVKKNPEQWIWTHNRWKL